MSAVLRWLRGDAGARLGASLATGLAVALMTGPGAGDGDHPWREARASLLAGRVVVFLLFGLLLFVLRQYGGPLRRVAAGRSAGMAPVAAATGAAGRARVLLATLRRNSLAVYLGYLALLAVAVWYPSTLSLFWQQVLTDQIGVFVLLALGLNVVVGLAGLLDLGYIAFYAIGAYTTAYLTNTGHPPVLPIVPPFHLNPFLVIPIAVLAAMLAGVVLGGPTLRLRGDYLAIVTLGFGEIVHITANNSDKITNGPRGAFGVPHFAIHLLGVNYAWKLDSLPYWYIELAAIVLIIVAFYRLENSRIGRAWTAIREDEVAAEASGVPTLRFKLLAFAIGASTSGFAGVIFASKVGFFNPDNFLLTFSLLVLVMVIFGGMGSLPGVVIGAAFLQYLPNALRDHVPPADRQIYYGAILVVMMIFRPQGLIPSRRRVRELHLAEEGIGGADALGGGV